MENVKSVFILIFLLCIGMFSCQVSEPTNQEEIIPEINVSNALNNRAVPTQNKLPQANQQIQQQVLGQNNKIPVDRRINVTDTFPEPAAPPFARNRIQVALLLDTSNSMDGLIDQAKSQLWKMVNELAKTAKEGEDPQIEISLFEYGNDRLDAVKGYIRKVSRLTIDLEFVSDRLFELKTKGGSEFCGWAIKDAVEILDWSDNPNDLKIIFIAGNEEFTQGKIDYKLACQKAKEKGIIINTIHCGDYDTGVRHMWGDGAACSGGKYMNIDQSKKVVHIPTPYDDKVLELNKKLNETYIGYGNLGSSRKTMQELNDVKSESYSSANTRTRAFYKTKSNYKNETWDLVDATETNYDEVIKKVGDKELPKEMQELSDQERKKYIEDKRAERKKLQILLKGLEKNVDEFIAKKKKEMAAEGEENTLDNVMMSTIRKQAEKKKFLFK